MINKYLVAKLVAILVFYRVVIAGVFAWLRAKRFGAHDALQLPEFEAHLAPHRQVFMGGPQSTLHERIAAFEKMGKHVTLYKEKSHGFFPAVSSLNPRHLSILAKLGKPDGFKVLANFMGNESIMFQSGDRGKRDRHRLNLAFGADKLQEELFPVMQRSAQRLGRRLRGKDAFDPFTEFTTSTFEVLAESNFGNSAAVSSAREHFLQLLVIGTNPVAFLPGGVKLISWYYQKALTSVQTTIDQVLRGANGEQETGGLLQVMMALPEEEGGGIEGVNKTQWVGDNLKFFLFAGVETSATTLLFCMLLLSTRTHYQERIAEEIAQVVTDREEGGDGGEIRFADLSKLKFTEAVIKESLRLYTPAVTVARSTPSDVGVEVDGVLIPPGFWFNLNIVQMHRRDDFFSNPHEFIPERWMPGETNETANEQGFFPFSSGVRSCIGKHFAMMQLKLVMASLFGAAAGGKRFKPASGETVESLPDAHFFKAVLAPVRTVKLQYA